MARDQVRPDRPEPRVIFRCLRYLFGHVYDAAVGVGVAHPAEAERTGNRLALDRAHQHHELVDRGSRRPNEVRMASVVRQELAEYEPSRHAVEVSPCRRRPSTFAERLPVPLGAGTAGWIPWCSCFPGVRAWDDSSRRRTIDVINWCVRERSSACGTVSNGTAARGTDLPFRHRASSTPPGAHELHLQGFRVRRPHPHQVARIHANGAPDHSTWHRRDDTHIQNSINGTATPVALPNRRTADDVHG